jgi:hypothetical protein
VQLARLGTSRKLCFDSLEISGHQAFDAVPAGQWNDARSVREITRQYDRGSANTYSSTTADGPRLSRTRSAPMVSWARAFRMLTPGATQRDCSAIKIWSRIRRISAVDRAPISLRRRRDMARSALLASSEGTDPARSRSVAIRPVGGPDVRVPRSQDGDHQDREIEKRHDRRDVDALKTTSSKRVLALGALVERYREPTFAQGPLPIFSHTSLQTDSR